MATAFLAVSWLSLAQEGAPIWTELADSCSGLWTLTKEAAWAELCASYGYCFQLKWYWIHSKCCALLHTWNFFLARDANSDVLLLLLPWQVLRSIQVLRPTITAEWRCDCCELDWRLHRGQSRTRPGRILIPWDKLCVQFQVRCSSCAEFCFCFNFQSSTCLCFEVVINGTPPTRGKSILNIWGLLTLPDAIFSFLLSLQKCSFVGRCPCSPLSYTMSPVDKQINLHGFTHTYSCLILVPFCFGNQYYNFVFMTVLDDYNHVNCCLIPGLASHRTRASPFALFVVMSTPLRPSVAKTSASWFCTSLRVCANALATSWPWSTTLVQASWSCTVFLEHMYKRCSSTYEYPENSRYG